MKFLFLIALGILIAAAFVSASRNINGKTEALTMLGNNKLIYIQTNFSYFNLRSFFKAEKAEVNRAAHLSSTQE
jgi:hypothetical protein